MRNRWLLVIGAFVILFAIFYHFFPHQTLAPTQTNSPTNEMTKLTPGVFEADYDRDNPGTKFILNYPDSCTEGIQASNDVMPNSGNITCKGFVIIPNALGHGLGQVIPTREEKNINLNGANWTRVVLTSDSWPKGSATSTYTKPQGNYFSIEIDYTNYSEENQNVAESIISTFKLKK